MQLVNGPTRNRFEKLHAFLGCDGKRPAYERQVDVIGLQSGGGA